jgi:hypothetical protein
MAHFNGTWSVRGEVSAIAEGAVKIDDLRRTAH